MVENNTNYDVLKRKRKEINNITTENIGNLMLSSIPGVSDLIAASIMNQ